LFQYQHIIEASILLSANRLSNKLTMQQKITTTITIIFFIFLFLFSFSFPFFLLFFYFYSSFFTFLFILCLFLNLHLSSSRLLTSPLLLLLYPSVPSPLSCPLPSSSAYSSCTSPICPSIFCVRNYINIIKNTTNALLDADKEVGLEVAEEKPSTCSCLVTRLQEKIVM
jgi:hypothetical protein